VLGTDQRSYCKVLKTCVKCYNHTVVILQALWWEHRCHSGKQC